jgi:hypothetical protein
MDLQTEIACQTKKKIIGTNFIDKFIGDYGILPAE